MWNRLIWSLLAFELVAIVFGLDQVRCIGMWLSAVTVVCVGRAYPRSVDSGDGRDAPHKGGPY